MISEEQDFQNLSPVDALKMRAESRNAQPPVSPQRASANLRQTGYDVASMTPVIGNVLAARDAYEQGGEVRDAARRGDIRGQRKAAIMTGMSALGALSPLPFGRMAGNAARGGSSRANIFAGVEAKTADHAALAQAQEMKAAGTSRDEIWRKTGWDLDQPDGVPRFEIDDSGMIVGRGNQTGVSGEVLSHPEAAAAFPALNDLPVSINADAPGDWMSFYQPKLSTAGPELRVRGHPTTRRSAAGHELQHGIDDLQDSLGTGAPYASPSEAHRAIEEVRARNVQWRMDMTAAERRAKAPWLTQDVPDEQQIVRGRSSGHAASTQNVTPKFDDDALNKIANAFGTTKEFSEAGYILPNGRFLDYSGAGANIDNFPFYSARGVRPEPGSTIFDHRDILNVDPSFSTGSASDWMNLANRTGLARIAPAGEGVEFFSIPTQSQLKTVLRSVQRGEINSTPYIGITDPATGRSIISKQFDKINLEALDDFVNKAKSTWNR